MNDKLVMTMGNLNAAILLVMFLVFIFLLTIGLTIMEMKYKGYITFEKDADGKTKIKKNPVYFDNKDDQ